MILQKTTQPAPTPRQVSILTDMYGKTYSTSSSGEFTEVSHNNTRYYKYQKGNNQLIDFLNVVENLVRQYQSQKMPAKFHTMIEANEKIKIYNTMTGFKCLLPCEQWDKF